MSLNSSLLFLSMINSTDMVFNYSNGYQETKSKMDAVSIESTDYILRKYSYPIICILGFIGNTMSGLAFLHHTLRKYSCSIFLAIRSISDNGVLFSLFIAWLDLIHIRIFHIQVVCQVTVFLSYTCSFLSVWCVVCVTIDNYIRLCHPSFVKVYCKAVYAIVVIGMLLFISLCIYHIPLWTTGIVDYKGQTYCMTMVPFYKIQHILTYIDTALTFVVPLSVILICMCLLICKAVTAHHRTSTNRERFNLQTWPSSTNHYLKVTRLLFAVSVIFLILHTPIHVTKLKLVIETFSGTLRQPSKMVKTLDYIFQILYALNFAVNFLVYYTFGKNFRHVYEVKFSAIFKCLTNFNENRPPVIIASTETILSKNVEVESLL